MTSMIAGHVTLLSQSRITVFQIVQETAGALRSHSFSLPLVPWRMTQVKAASTGRVLPQLRNPEIRNPPKGLRADLPKLCLERHIFPFSESINQTALSSEGSSYLCSRTVYYSNVLGSRFQNKNC